MKGQDGPGMRWLTTTKSCKKELKNHLPVQVPSLSASESCKWMLTSRGWWVTVHNCARRKRTSIICASNLPRLRVNITSRVHKVRTTLKRRSNLLACIGRPLLPQRGKIQASSKAAAVAAATAAAFFYQCIRERSPFVWREKSFERT